MRGTRKLEELQAIMNTNEYTRGVDKFIPASEASSSNNNLTVDQLAAIVKVFSASKGQSYHLGVCLQKGGTMDLFFYGAWDEAGVIWVHHGGA